MEVLKAQVICNVRKLGIFGMYIIQRLYSVQLHTSCSVATPGAHVETPSLSQGDASRSRFGLDSYWNAYPCLANFGMSFAMQSC